MRGRESINGQGGIIKGKTQCDEQKKLLQGRIFNAALLYYLLQVAVVVTFPTSCRVTGIYYNKAEERERVSSTYYL